MSLSKIIKLIFEILGMVCLTALILLTIAAVFARYFLNSPLAWGEETQMICIIWAVMFGGIACAWEKVALAIDIVPNLLGPKWKSRLERFSCLVTFLTMIPLVYYGYRLSLIGRNKITNILYIPYTYINVAIPVGAAGIALVSLVYVFRPKKEKPPRSSQESQTSNQA
ncbi:MAG: TRAP transporter small permease [Deltaproteobacteria bacterium]|jgi:TRAP-type C4-dicarboxylate transport system permease small subunit|nr:TRAP transporter small permease [Deltaproteobacteria bacterium]